METPRTATLLRLFVGARRHDVQRARHFGAGAGTTVRLTCKLIETREGSWPPNVVDKIHLNSLWFAGRYTSC